MKAAVSRLEFGPEPEEMEVTDIATGHFVFRPVEGEAVSFGSLEEAIVNAGYEIEDASLTLAGKVTDEGNLETPDGQVFELTAADAAGEERLDKLEPGSETSLTATWKMVEGAEVLVLAAEPEAAEGEP